MSFNTQTNTQQRSNIENTGEEICSGDIFLQNLNESDSLEHLFNPSFEQSVNMNQIINYMHQGQLNQQSTDSNNDIDITLSLIGEQVNNSQKEHQQQPDMQQSSIDQIAHGSHHSNQQQSQQIESIFQEDSSFHVNLNNQCISRHTVEYDAQPLGVRRRRVFDKKQAQLHLQYRRNPNRQPKKQDTNNIGLIMFRSVCNFIKLHHSDLYNKFFIDNKIVQKQNGLEQKKTLGNKEMLRSIFQEECLQSICINYLSGSYFIRELATKTRLKDKRVVMKYLGSYIESAINPDGFDRIKRRR